MSAWKEEGWRVEGEEGLSEMQYGDGECLRAWEMEVDLRPVQRR